MWNWSGKEEDVWVQLSLPDKEFVNEVSGGCDGFLSCNPVINTLSIAVGVHFSDIGMSPSDRRWRRFGPKPRSVITLTHTHIYIC